MDFLQLCKETANDCGTIAGVPSITTTVGLTGRAAQLVGWVRDAYIDIQNERPDWLWLRQTFSAPLTIGKRDYTGAELGLTRLQSFIPDTPELRTMSLYDSAIGQADEGEIRWVPWNWYRQTYDRGYHDPQRAQAWTAAPGGKLFVGPTPDKAYVLRGEYRASPQRLELDADIPEMPAAYHRLIQGEAIRLAARSDEAFQVLIERADMYQRLRNPLVIEQTPTPSIAEEPIG